MVDSRRRFSRFKQKIVPRRRPIAGLKKREITREDILYLVLYGTGTVKHREKIHNLINILQQKKQRDNESTEKPLIPQEFHYKFGILPSAYSDELESELNTLFHSGLIKGDTEKTHKEYGVKRHYYALTPLSKSRVECLLEAYRGTETYENLMGIINKAKEYNQIKYMLTVKVIRELDMQTEVEKLLI